MNAGLLGALSLDQLSGQAQLSQYANALHQSNYSAQMAAHQAVNNRANTPEDELVLLLLDDA